MTITAIFFDLDDTLWDFRQSSRASLDMVFAHYLLDHGISKEDWLAHYALANKELWTSYQSGVHSADEVKELRFQRSFAQVGICLTRHAVGEVSQYYLAEIVRNTRLYPGVKQVLSELSASYELGIISNGMAVSRDRLDAHGIGQYFRRVVTASDAGAPKPAVEIFAHAMAEARVSADRAAYVGDDYHSDVLGSKGAGMFSVWYNPEGKAAPAPVVPDRVISTFTELTEIFVSRR